MCNENVGGFQNVEGIEEIVSVVMVVALSAAISVPAFAADKTTFQNNVAQAKSISEQTAVINSAKQRLLKTADKPIRLTETWLPTEFYDLGKSDYDANLELVGPGPVALEIGIYNMKTNQIDATFTSGYGSHISDSMCFYNLNKNTNYAIAFTCLDQSSVVTDHLTGSAHICH